MLAHDERQQLLGQSPYLQSVSVEGNPLEEMGGDEKFVSPSGDVPGSGPTE